jgi:hypothetical protein
LPLSVKAIPSRLVEDAMRCLLVRVGVDRSAGGGFWNAPVKSSSGEFAFVPIPETKPVHPGVEKPYAALTSVLGKFRVTLPEHLQGRHMHLDPDFDHLTYGDQGERAKQLQKKLQPGDRIVFYSGMKDVRGRQLVYALIGLIVVEDIVLATSVPEQGRDCNAHLRRLLPNGAQDIIVQGNRELSGRLERCILSESGRIARTGCGVTFSKLGVGYP